jgi:hypothetical protein
VDGVGREIRRALFAGQGAVQVRFGRGSEAAVFCGGGHLSVGVVLSQADLRREAELLRLVNSSRGAVVERSPKMRVGASVGRALLLRFPSEAKVSAVLELLRHWSGRRSRFTVRPAVVSLVGGRIPLRLGKMAASKRKTSLG